LGQLGNYQRAGAILLYRIFTSIHTLEFIDSPGAWISHPSFGISATHRISHLSGPAQEKVPQDIGASRVDKAQLLHLRNPARRKNLPQLAKMTGVID
jgi:hypothetical protein